MEAAIQGLGVLWGGSGKVNGSYFLGFRVRDLKANPACEQPSQHANVLLHTR